MIVMTDEEAMLMFCRTSATMAEVAAAYGTDEDTMRDIVAREASGKQTNTSMANIWDQTQQARQAYIAAGVHRMPQALAEERSLAVTLCIKMHLSAYAVGRAFGRDATTVRGWVRAYKANRGVMVG